MWCCVVCVLDQDTVRMELRSGACSLRERGVPLANEFACVGTCARCRTSENSCCAVVFFILEVRYEAHELVYY